ncbi:MAG: hypothetical protein EB143_04935 [Actinobacteria bacterium]|nr:hypothetical protein [Actinomycetota bacterium]
MCFHNVFFASPNISSRRQRRRRITLMNPPDPSQHDQSLASIEFRMREAGRWLNLEDGVIETLIAPRRVLEVSIPIRRDDGSRASATGRGVVEAASLVCQANGTSLEGKRIVIQGFGNVGMWAARLAAGWGAKIVGVSDVGGVIASEKGLDVQALMHATQSGVGSVVDAGVGEVIARGVKSSAKVFELPSDIAMPCALGGAVDKDEAVSLTAKYVIEGANGPLTPAADEVLNDRGVIVVPDIYANAGGVTCSYLEQCQNYAHLQWDEDEVNASVVNTMRAVFKRLHTFSTENGLTYRAAASVLGVKALADAHQLRGLHP